MASGSISDFGTSNSTQAIVRSCQPPDLIDRGDIVTSASSTMWAVRGDIYVPCDKATDILPKGSYVVDSNPQHGYFFRQIPVNCDDLLVLPDSSSDEVIQEIANFWTLENNFKRFGFLWKRGILLYGPAGSGKTSTIQLICQQVNKMNNIAIFATHPGVTTIGLRLLRQVEPNRPIIVILEDIDAIVANYGESEVLSLLDGENQIDKVVYLATTNYPERLDRRIVDRPSRFDVVKKIGMPTPESRYVYIKHVLARNSITMTKNELNKWVESTENFSVAHIKELIIAHYVFEANFDATITRLREMMETKSRSDEDDKPKIQGYTPRKRVGFCP